MKAPLVLLVALLALVAAPSGAPAQSDLGIGYAGWGPRFGMTVDPDQVHFGAHVDLGNFSDHVRFQPNFELGIGDDMTIGALNFEAAYRFVSRWEAWSPYMGGGLGMNFIDRSDAFRDRSDTEVGVNVLGGLEKGMRDGGRFFMEMKFGLEDSPDVKVTSGMTFYH